MRVMDMDKDDMINYYEFVDYWTDPDHVRPHDL